MREPSQESLRPTTIIFKKVIKLLQSKGAPWAQSPVRARHYTYLHILHLTSNHNPLLLTCRENVSTIQWISEDQVWCNPLSDQDRPLWNTRAHKTQKTPNWTSLPVVVHVDWHCASIPVECRGLWGPLIFTFHRVHTAIQISSVASWAIVISEDPTSRRGPSSLASATTASKQGTGRNSNGPYRRVEPMHWNVTAAQPMFLPAVINWILIDTCDRARCISPVQLSSRGYCV